MQSILSIKQLTKTYASGFQALKSIDLEIYSGEIFALLGPNGAGKTTLISIVCGIVNPTSGTVTADGHDIVVDYRAARAKIGLVPQELSTDAFETVWATVKFSRGLFGKAPNPEHLEKVLRDLSLWDKKDSKIMTLSGGMKRCPTSHESCFWTSRAPASTCSCAATCGRWFASFATPGSRSSSLPITSKRPKRWPIASV
jgi:ABC-2 type transport system ATP-binding protein